LSVARAKQVPTAERQTVTIRYSVEPYFAVSCDDPKLRGIKGIGATKREALANMRAAVRRTYPFSGYDIVEERASDG
jgi:hypothetical protein